MIDQSIPVIEARGSYRQVGRAIGEQARSHIQAMLADLQGDLPAGVTWEDLLSASRDYEAFGRSTYPQYVEELEGIAEGAGAPFDQIWLAMCEELWEQEAWRAGAQGLRRGCTDMAARGSATSDGHTLLAHTNDLSADDESTLVILKIQVGNEPEIIAISVGGVGISAGFNAAGIALSGNQVDCNDLRPGVPRLLMVRAILAARRLGEAMRVCLLPQRASNYNNVIADAHGEVYSMEGSATDCEPIYIEGDILAHANHYVSSPMRRFEADRSAIADSVIRHNRAIRLLRENHGRLSPELFKRLLADHANYPASICRHGEDTTTAFSMILDLTELRAWIGRGRPCETTFETLRLDPWPSGQA